jgi:hypothetical protein
MLDEAADMEPGCARQELAVAALRKALALVGRASQPGADSEQDAIAAGAARVDAVLPSEQLRAALGMIETPTAADQRGDEDVRAVLSLCEWTDALVDDRSPRRKKFERGAAIATGVVAVLALSHALFGSRNLAYGKRVTASSICSLAPPAPFNESQLSRVVDGVRHEIPQLPMEWAWAAFGACTNVQPHAWIAVDLGQVRTVSRAVVYGRSDCCWRDTLPLAIQISMDNRRFETVATTDAPFTSEFPWEPSLEGRRARYVRLSSTSRAPKSVVVNELEVYGR